jgi:thiamine pyrophosphate-dependent acetolactate synthase large subunit-like protein
MSKVLDIWQKVTQEQRKFIKKKITSFFFCLYFTISGKPGVVLVTSGPGATNVMTPLADALADGTPLVVFCGQVPTSAIGTDAFQEGKNNN